MKSQGATRILATLAVLLLVAQPVAAASVGTGHQYRSPSSSDSGDFGDEDGFSDEEFSEETGADVVYVKQNGDAVLVYNSSGSEDAGAEVGTGIGEEGEKKAGDTYASFGADISAGLMHFLANGTVGFDKFDGTMNYLVEPNSASLNASFSTGLDAVKRLSVDVSGVTNDRRSNLDADMSAKIRSKFAALLSNSGTSGRLVVRADSLVSSGNLSFGVSLGGLSGGSSGSVRQVTKFDLRRVSDGYLLESRERKTVSKPFSYSSSFEESPPTPETEFRGNTSSQEDSEPLTVATPNGTSSNTPIEPPVDPRKKWRTRQKALETLRSRYNSTANRLGANFSLTLESYTFRNVTVESGFGAPENKSLLDISYRVKFTDVKKGLVDSLARNLSNSTEYDVSRETAEELARKISEVSLNRLMFRSVSEGSSFDARWKVDVSNYSGALTSYLKLLSEMEREKRVFSGNVFASSLRRTKKTIEAMKAANLVTKLTWSFDVEPTTSSVSIDGNISRTARNWGSYVDELRSRGLETPADTRLNLDVGKEGDRVQGVLNWSATEKGTLKQGIDSMLRYFENGTKRSKALRKLRGSEFEKAKMVASIDDGNWSFEAGARFGNGNALSEAIRTATDLEVTEVVGRNESDGFTTYVKVSGLVGQTTEEAVRALNVTSDETKVLLPGEWDRGFPTMDAQSAKEFLSSEEKSPLLGFGFAVSFVALAVVAVFILRRRR